MAPLPADVVLGIYLGILTGIVPGLVAWGLGFVVRYFTGVTVPGFGVVVLSLAIAGVNGGLLALNDPTIRANASGTTILVAIVVVLMISLYAHSKGDEMGASFPRRISWRGLRERTLSTDVVELVGGRGQVRVEITGDIADMEGYPPLPDGLRREIRTGEWTLPADLPLSELEVRFADRLRHEFDLADVSVHLDENARATVVAAPPLSALSKRIPADKRAVSVEALIPTGVGRGDVVDVALPGEYIRGTVVSATTDGGDRGSVTRHVIKPDGNGGDANPNPDPDPDPRAPLQAPTTDGGDGRITVAVSRGEAEKLLDVTRAQITVRSRGRRREYELLSLLRRAGKRFRKFTIRGQAELGGVTLGQAGVREKHGVAVLAVRSPDGWVIAPRGTTALTAGDELFAVGTPDALDAFAEVVA